jgi:RecA-family ATPase
VDLESCAVDWLWTVRVPLGMITMFAGDPKLGKSYVSLAMAAALSRGLPLPLSDRPDQPGSTILMSAEDDPTRTIARRLIAAGADLTKVHVR